MKTPQRVKKRVDHYNRNRARSDRMIRRLVAGDSTIIREVLGELREAFDASGHTHEPPRLGHWIMLPDGELRRASLLEWGQWFENIDNRRVARDEFGDGHYVSTVCLGVDHNFSGEGPPILFETMANIAGHWAEDVMRRYATYAEALAGHRELVAQHRAAQAKVEQIKKMGDPS